MKVDGFLDEPVAEVSIKPWHIIALLGVGGLAAYFLLRKKEVPVATPPAPKNEASPATTSGLGDFADLGEQVEPLYDGHPIVDTARGYADEGWTVFKMPTGHENVMNNRERFQIHKIFAAPPGRRLPSKAIKVSL